MTPHQRPLSEALPAASPTPPGRRQRSWIEVARVAWAMPALTLRSEVDLADLSDQLLAVVEETMQPAQAWLWLRSDDREVRS